MIDLKKPKKKNMEKKKTKKKKKNSQFAGMSPYVLVTRRATERVTG